MRILRPCHMFVTWEVLLGPLRRAPMVRIRRPCHTFVTWEGFLGLHVASWDGSHGEKPRRNHCVAKL